METQTDVSDLNMETCIRENLANIPIPIYASLGERYNAGEVIGKGSFGQVLLGTPTQTTCNNSDQLIPSSLVSVYLLKILKIFLTVLLVLIETYIIFKKKYKI